jgi:hypothetical protein
VPRSRLGAIKPWRYQALALSSLGAIKPWRYQALALSSLGAIKPWRYQFAPRTDARKITDSAGQRFLELLKFVVAGMMMIRKGGTSIPTSTYDFFFQSLIAVCSSAAGCLWTKGLSYRRNVLILAAAGTQRRARFQVEVAIKKYYE